MKTTASPIRRNFTLAEIVVAMGVFSIIMLMLFRLFASSQQVWSSAEARSNRYADARVAMDLMANALQSAFFAPDTTIMLIGDGNNQNPRDVITFPVKMTTHYGCMDDSFESDEPALFFIRFSLGKSERLTPAVTDDEKPGYLYLSTFGKKDDSGLYEELIGPYVDKASAQRCAKMMTAFTKGNVQDDARKQDIIQGITRLEFNPIMPDYEHTKLVWKLPKYVNGDHKDNTLDPVAVEIKMWLLDRADYERWLTLNGGEILSTTKTENPAAEAFREANEFLFTRLVHLPTNR